MALIALEGMEFFAKHGFYKEEQIIGGEYVVDVHITTDIKKAAVSDKLDETINYETVYLVCKAEMKRPSKLIENVAERIVLGLKHQFKTISEITVRVKKKNPPLGGKVAAAFVEVDGEYSKKCARCTRPMLCYQDKKCWCMDALIYGKTLDHIKAQYGNQCLCGDCMRFYAAAME